MYISFRTFVDSIIKILARLISTIDKREIFFYSCAISLKLEKKEKKFNFFIAL